MALVVLGVGFGFYGFKASTTMNVAYRVCLYKHPMKRRWLFLCRGSIWVLQGLHEVFRRGSRSVMGVR